MAKFTVTRSKQTTKPSVSKPKTVFNITNNAVMLNILGVDVDGNCDIKNYLDYQDVFELKYEIVGGFENNAVKVNWCYNDDNKKIDWICLSGFTGVQIKYTTKENEIIFALAQEDAYVYCDEDPCLECTFRCKRGFDLFVSFDGEIYELKLDNMRTKWG